MNDNLANVQLNYVDSAQKAQEFIDWLSQRRPGSAIAIDTETGEKLGRPTSDALSPWHGQLRLVQVGDGMTGWSIPWQEWGGVFYEAMEKYSDPIVCHNIAFEAKWFDVHTRWKMPWHKAHDIL